MLVKSIKKLLSKITILIAILIAILPMFAFSFSDDFLQFFAIKYLPTSILLIAKPNIYIPEENLTALHRLYNAVNNYNQLELYLTDNGKKLVMVPVSRLKLFNCAPVNIQLLSESTQPEFIFTLDYLANLDLTKIKAEAVTSEIKNTLITAKNQQLVIPVKYVFSPEVIENLVKYLANVNLEVKSHAINNILAQPQPQPETLVWFAYKKSIVVNCLLSSNVGVVSRSYCLCNLLSCDAYRYGKKSLNYVYQIYKDHINTKINIFTETELVSK